MPRQRLSSLLHKAVVAHRLTLISAPAGYGKTTLTTTLAHTATDLAFAWLSLDEEDDNPTAFLIAFVAALQKLNPDFGRARWSDHMLYIFGLAHWHQNRLDVMRQLYSQM